MLTAETKRHIDSARQILVGKVPDPKQQIDQITNALIYKFMDDMDVKSIDSGGKASFFTGDLGQYAWRKLMNPRKGSQERLNLYTEALEKFSTAEQLPPLFRDIFRQAFLPYRDPETLNLFLKEIEFFDYNHSEELGNAFEYLLSIMGAQGDAGQFRTPRHIIDFIVEILDPDMDDTILDPACGTAGFLISAYKHIVEKHDNKDKKNKLTHTQHQKMLDNMVGYDISSDMVKLARVNMYLHGNRSPQIFEYDTLSNEECWNDNFNIIMANPPFMSPRGGIRPHNKFSVKSSRAEVLFVDYIMTHLKQNGRAGIIVPEGIIFQSGTAYKQLRRLLVEDGLLAVISLPAGVFNPYSGVKTSVLIFDNNRAKQSKDILFAKVENDGFSLSAQRRPTPGQNDLPIIAKTLKQYRQGKLKTQKQV
ncbi:MAG TPA: N-6 DNA methylase, partial [Candidatus Saccharimonadales bacterium]|nr:N-6 DNA methylase [Candidatus Saccharimonadales bacterium]